MKMFLIFTFIFIFIFISGSILGHLTCFAEVQNVTQETAQDFESDEKEEEPKYTYEVFILPQPNSYDLKLINQIKHNFYNEIYLPIHLPPPEKKFS